MIDDNRFYFQALEEFRQRTSPPDIRLLEEFTNDEFSRILLRAQALKDEALASSVQFREEAERD